MKRQVFFSFHFDNDVMRVQQIRNIGAVEGNEPVSSNAWEEVKKKGDEAIKKWIDDNMKYKSCVIVLIGTETADRRWVKYEIEKAWTENKAVLGIYIHNLKCPRKGTCSKGQNPFDKFTVDNGKSKLSSLVRCYDPNPSDAYNDIARNIGTWIENALDE